MRIYPYLTFYIPGYYTIRSRRSSLKAIVRFLLIYFLPIFIFLFWRECSISNLLLAFLLVYDLYEIGYIENDCETIKKEDNPTLRLESSEYQFYERHRFSVYAGKIVVAVLIAAYLYSHSVALWICISSFLLIPSYLVYNRIRCKWNLLLHVWLMFIRYYVPVLIAIGVFYLKDAMAFLFVYPIRVMIELSVKGKFGGYQNILVKRYILHDYSKFQTYRLKYYALSVIVISIFYGCTMLDISVVALYVYYLIFTFLSKANGIQIFR